MIDALSLLAGCLLAAGAPAPDGGAAAPAVEEHFLISFRGRVIGKARRTLAEETRGGERRLVLTVEEHYRFAAGDRPAAESALRRVAVMLPDWTPVSIEETNSGSGEEAKRSSAKFEAGKAVFTLPGAAGAREVAVAGAVVAEMTGQALAARGKLAAGAELAASVPDLVQGGLVPLRAAVIGEREDGRTKLRLLLVSVKAGAGQEWDLLVEPSGALVEQSSGDVVRRRVDAREAVLPDRPEALWSGFVPLADAPESFARLAAMTVVLELPEPAKGLVPALPGQAVSESGRRFTVTLSERQPNGKLPAAELSADERRRWLESENEPDWRDAKLAAQAAEIVRGQGGSLRKGFLIGRWVYRNLVKSLGGPPEASAKQALAARSGDCSEHAALFAALCRAAGVPARTAYGLAGSRGALRFHVWSEFHDGQSWVPVDAALGRFGLPAAYLTLSYDREEAGVRLFKLYASAKGRVTETSESRPAPNSRPAER